MPPRKPVLKQVVPRFPREPQARKGFRALEILTRLRREYPGAHCELTFDDPYQLVVATILSAQCTDARVNMVTPELFRRWPDAAALAAAHSTEIEDVIRSTGFFRNKAKSLLGLARGLVAAHGGTVPRTMDELRPLPGIGRKTANVVLGNAFGLNVGVTVDTHVMRLSSLLALSREHDPVKIERDLMKLFPQEDWTLISHLLIWHGRRVCIANRPRCTVCVLNDICPSARS